MFNRKSKTKFNSSRTQLGMQLCEERCVPAWVVIPNNAIAVAPQDGGIPQVSIVDPSTGNDIDSIQAYENSFRGGVHVSLGDVTGDGVKDVIIAPGAGGGPRIRVLDGKTGSTVRDFFVYEQSFTGGVYVSVGDVNGDGVGDIITGTGNGGGPRIRVLDGKTAGATTLQDYFAYEDSFRGGVIVSSGDVNGDGKDDIVTGTGVGGGPRVEVFSGADRSELANFFAYEDSFRGGVTVASGDVNGDGKDDLICGTGPGGAPSVKVVDGKNGSVLSSFFTDDSNFRGGVFVDAVDSNHDGRAEVIAHVRNGNDLSTRTFDGKSGAFEDSMHHVVDDNPSSHSSTPNDSVTNGVPSEVEGTIASINSATNSVTILLTGGATFTGTVSTGANLERNGAHVALSQFLVADRVEALVGPNGVIWEMENKLQFSGGNSGGSNGGSGGSSSSNSQIEGTIQSVDTSAGTVSIKKQDGTVVVVTTNSNTKIERNDLHVTLAAFKVGDFGEAKFDASGQTTKLEAVGA